MNKLAKIVCLLLSLCMLAGCAVAQETAVTPVADDEVVVVLNGQQITWADVAPTYDGLVAEYGSYYDLTSKQDVDLFRAIAVENVIVEKLLLQKADEYGLTLTDEEREAVIARADGDYAAAIDNYALYNGGLTAESTDEEKAAAIAAAEAYYADLGYGPEQVRANYLKYEQLGRIEALTTQDVTVTDADVEAYYQGLVEADRAMYENDIAAYSEYNDYVDYMMMYSMYYGGGDPGLDYAWYKPAGFRGVRHILLPVDEAIMSEYTAVQAAYEEHNNAEAAAADGETVATTDEPVTLEQVKAAEAAVLASKADVIDEINQKIAEGVDFDELITTYGVNADGTPSDPGMASNPYYEVWEGSTTYVPEFTAAAMSIEEVGGVSAPYVSSYGIHIVKYVLDVPAGPVELTDERRAEMHSELLQSRQSEAYAAAIDAWLAESEVTYTGVIPSYDEVIAAEEAAAADGETTESTETTETTETPAE